MAVLRRIAAVDTSTAAIAANSYFLQQMVGGGGTYGGEGAWFTPGPPPPPLERPLGPWPPCTRNSTLKKGALAFKERYFESTR
jgi:hypothetical protein